MAETFEATLRLKPQGYRYYPKAFTFEDVNTGKEYNVFPTELAKLIEGVEIEGTWAETARGGYPAIKLVKGVE
jgi:hypothetical protein